MSLFDTLTSDNLPLNYRIPQWNADVRYCLNNIVTYNDGTSTGIYIALANIEPTTTTPNNDSEWREIGSGSTVILDSDAVIRIVRDAPNFIDSDNIESDFLTRILSGGGTGLQGPTGLSGTDGTSLGGYRFIAVSGSDSEYDGQALESDGVTLIGPVSRITVPRGPQGIQGLPGIQGDPGIDGTNLGGYRFTPVTGSDSEYEGQALESDGITLVGPTSRITVPRGPQGARGLPGTNIIDSDSTGGFVFDSDGSFPPPDRRVAQLFTQEIDGVEYHIEAFSLGPAPVISFSVNRNLNVGDSSVYSTLPTTITLTVTRATGGTLTSISNQVPSILGTSITNNVASWPSASFLIAGTHPFQVSATGTDSAGASTTIPTSRSFLRYVPSFISATQPLNANDVTSGTEVRSETTFNSLVSNITYFSTTRNFGATATGTTPQGFIVRGPITDESPITVTDRAGISRDYYVYEFNVSTDNLRIVVS